MAPVLAVLLGSLWAAVVASAAQVFGVLPADAEMYEASVARDNFACIDGNRTLPGASVNDNYCDCDDGSDEPGTAACAGKPGRLFYCANRASAPRLVYASRVGDGVCDCCDGSDELGPDGRPGTCPHTCEAEGLELKAARERRRAALAQGLASVEASVKEAEAQIAGWREELARLEREIPALEEAQRKAEEEEKARKEAEREAEQQAAAKAEETLLWEDFESPDAAERWQVADGGTGSIVEDPDGERGKVLKLSGCTWGGDTFSTKGLSCTVSDQCTISFKACGAPWQGFSCGTHRTEEVSRDAHSWAVMPVGVEGFKNRLQSSQPDKAWETFEYEFPRPLTDSFETLGSPELIQTFSNSEVHIMVQAHESTGFCTETMFDDFKVWKKRPAEKEAAASAAEPAEPAREAEEGGGEAAAQQEGAEEKKVISEYAKWALDDDVDKALEHDYTAGMWVGEKAGDEGAVEDSEEAPSSSSSFSASSSPAPPQGATPEKDAAKALDRARDRVTELTNKLSRDLGDGFRWYPLIDKCTKKRFDEYDYQICYFDHADQGHTRLGRYEGWDKEKPSVMLFGGGTYCPGGPARSLRVQFVCAAEEDILEVSEPSRCTYEAVVRHPGACRHEDLAALEEEERSGGAVQMPHEEL